MSTEIQQPRRRGRPPKNRDSYVETRDLLIRSGLEVLTEKGFAATGIDEVLKRVKVPKGSFYHYFASKQEFGAALIDSYAGFYRHKLERFLDDDSLTPLARIDAFVDDACAAMDRFEFRRGCLIGNLGQEMSALPEDYRAQLIAVFEDWQDKIEACLDEARKAGEIKSETDCRQAAYLFWIGWEGAVLRAKLEQNEQPLRQFAEFYLAGIKSPS